LKPDVNERDLCMNRRSTWNRHAQLVVVLLCALGLKLHYSTASANQLRWILAPTTVLVELVSGARFEFESYAGYSSSDHTFLIAASCAGVNFLITSFLMLSLRRLWRIRSQNGSTHHESAWRFIPIAALFAYLTTLVANTVRISDSLQMRKLPPEIGWLSPNQLHRFEGVFIYFGFLLLSFVLSEKLNYRTASGPGSPRGQQGSSPESDRMLIIRSENSTEPGNRSGFFRQALFPLLIYYITTLGIPLAYGVYHRGAAAKDFREHSVFVLLTPLFLILVIAAFRFSRDHFATASSRVLANSQTLLRSILIHAKPR
jgi:exosortase K